jgi:hypothetical protein
VTSSLAASTIGIRSISSTASYQKGPIDATKDTLKKADRAVSDAAVGGINKGGMYILGLNNEEPSKPNSDTNVYIF